MSATQNLHRLAGALDRLRREAATGPCALHPGRPSVGYIEGADLRPRGTCEACEAQGERLGYTVNTAPEETTP